MVLSDVAAAIGRGCSRVTVFVDPAFLSDVCEAFTEDGFRVRSDGDVEVTIEWGHA
jgi:hypothetical protein